MAIYSGIQFCLAQNKVKALEMPLNPKKLTFLCKLLTHVFTPEVYCPF